jgi:hypothetical protein
VLWRKVKRRQMSAFPPPVDWSRQVANVGNDDAAPTWMAELEPKLDTLREQQRAIRDILFLYRGLADTRGISGDDHLGSFDPWRWLQCEPDYDGGVWRSYDDALLLRQGSAVALLSEWLGEWQHGEPDEHLWKVALEERRFDHLPEARSAVQAGLEGTDGMYPHLAVVYDEYVLAFFEMLAREGRAPQGTAFSEVRPRSSFREPR